MIDLMHNVKCLVRDSVGISQPELQDVIVHTRSVLYPLKTVSVFCSWTNDGKEYTCDISGLG